MRGADSKPSLKAAFVFAWIMAKGKHTMNTRKAMLTSSQSGSGWLSASLAISLLVIWQMAGCHNFSGFYHAAMIQSLSNFALYAEVNRKTYKWQTLVPAYLTRFFSFAVFAVAMLFFGFGESSMPIGSSGYAMRLVFEAERMCNLFILLLAIPFFQAVVELVVHMVAD